MSLHLEAVTPHLSRRISLLARTALCLGLSAWISAPWPVRAATIIVDTTADTGTGNCTLREAIQAADTDSAVDACTAGSGTDLIDMTGISGTITLDAASGGLVIGSSMTIAGPGARSLRISGSALSPTVQMIVNFNGAIVEIKDVTIADKVGEGPFEACLIPCSGTLTLTRVRVTNCTSVPTSGPLGQDGKGGALSTNCSNANVTIRDSTFDANKATGSSNGGAQGGAIWWAGLNLFVTNATFSGNSSDAQGGALWLAPFGGGNVVLRNVTLSDNTAGASGAAIYPFSGTTRLANSVLADSNLGGNCATAGGTIASDGYNLSDDAICGLSGTGDQDTVEDGLPKNLTDNGGPTDTDLPDLASPLVDGGNPGGCTDETGAPLTTDQRGVARPQGPRCDIGAVEVARLNFHCWKFKDLKNPPFVAQTVQLADQFATATVEVKKPYVLCAPAGVNGSPVSDPSTHQCCYKIKGPKLTPSAHVMTNDQFGSHELEVKKSALLCQSCLKTVLP